ncbi:hypothetical protein OUZ56_002046 [Daphnia magna]|uniref:Uncharacterized protein n=1 Tax=Daphnia magna TaxID=35525 RepID=A0ABR0A4Y6_9CRUS|nr:hypothetical protein OUZ56_002046 [Daphnia magna]
MRISTSYVAVLFITVAFRWCCFATVFGGVPIFDENEEEKSISYWEESEQNLKASKKKEREMVRAGYLAP